MDEILCVFMFGVFEVDDVDMLIMVLVGFFNFKVVMCGDGKLFVYIFRGYVKCIDVLEEIIGNI